ncbi:MAG: triose-phosphate isomerase [Candidatus Melainabacteria bacterium HGW-Melainabacteria-1]|nr:MAG: triose-phosphate isomerase [Candidatus Melainabacteria bacterium HGW-Melainabacteria-1]
MSQRKPVMAGNWKMHKSHTEALAFVAGLSAACLREEQVEAVICAPFTALASLQQALNGTQVKLGAQNLYHEPKGAYTGEISASMLTALGVSHVIVGHSERREYFGENDVLVNLKLKAALDNGLNPILCVGESLAEREAGGFEAKILRQVELGLSGISLSPSYHQRILIAYEPIWAIGTGKTCDDAEANRILGLIRRQLARSFGEDAAKAMRLLYGGSVKPSSMAGQITMPEIDGGLVGGASLEAESFSELVRLCAEHGR